MQNVTGLTLNISGRDVIYIYQYLFLFNLIFHCAHVITFNDPLKLFSNDNNYVLSFDFQYSHNKRDSLGSKLMAQPHHFPCHRI